MRIYILIFLIINALSVTSKNRKPEIFANASLLLGDFLWISKTEVSNFQYREFLEDYINDPMYAYLLPDTSLWVDEINRSEPYQNYYLRHPAYNNYPIVCLSKQNAIIYCGWLTKKLNAELELNESNTIKKVKVRLPNIWEWKYAARGGLSEWSEYPWEGTSLRINEGKDKGKFRLNFKRASGDFMGVAGNLNDQADITAPVDSYWPNAYGLYNMCGNVSEFVQDDDQAYGGNWSSSGYNVSINSKIKSKPSPLIGFRYVIEVIEWKSIKKSKSITLNKRFLNKLFTPIIDSLYFMKTEVTNQLYNHFIQVTNHKRPDSILWNGEFWYAEQFTNKYHWHPEYDDYPVVNISMKDVEIFSAWLTKEYIKNFNSKVVIRLPNEKEWITAARGKENTSTYYPWGGPFLRNSKGDFLCNYRTYPEIYSNYDENGNNIYELPSRSDPMLGSNLDGYSYVAPVISFYKNEYGLFNMSGNVAEMISQVNFTKGGSWKSESFFVQINSKEEYKNAAPNIGFRLILIKLE